MTKVQRIKSEWHEKILNQASKYIKTNNVNDELILKMSAEKETAVHIALENFHHKDLLHET